MATRAMPAERPGRASRVVEGLRERAWPNAQQDVRGGVPQNAQQDVRQVGKEVRVAGEQVARHPWTVRAARFGYVVRGLLYFLVGVLALQVALGAGDLDADHQGAIHALASQPLGQALMAATAVGLAGYALWGLIRAVLDPLGKGSDVKGLAQRCGYFISGVTHAGLCVIAVKYLAGVASDGGAASVETWTAWTLSKPLGAIVVAAAGVWLAGAGVGELFIAYKKDFCEDLRRDVMQEWEMDVASWVGRAGMAARGIVFGLTGGLVVLAALTADAKHARGLDGALETLAVSPFGPWLLSAVAAGLMVFGVYSACCARWMKVGG